LHHRPSARQPRNFGTLASGARLSVVDYADAIDGKLNPRPLPDGGVPAVHFALTTAMMGQRLDSWLLADDPQHGAFGMGLANIELKRGEAQASPNGESNAIGIEGRGWSWISRNSTSSSIKQPNKQMVPWQREGARARN